MSAVLVQAYFLFLEGDMDDAVMALGAVTGARSGVAWGAAPWSSDARLLGAVSAEARDEAWLRTLDTGTTWTPTRGVSGSRPWFDAIEVVSARSPVPESPDSRARQPGPAATTSCPSPWATAPMPQRRDPRLDIRYTACDGRRSERVPTQYGLVAHSLWRYVTGTDPAIGEDRTFRLDRITDARALPGSFEPPADHDPARRVLSGLATAPCRATR
ncbi:WYL domain-containing protein [Streptomyces sp. NPDC055400]